MLAVPLLAIIIVVALALTRQRRRRAESLPGPEAAPGAQARLVPSPGGGAEPEMSGLHRKLDQWAAEGLITAEQAAAILDRERGAVPPPSRVPLVAEAIGYVGGALVVTAVALLVGRNWDDLDVAARVAVLAVATAVTCIAGWWAGRSDEPALVRLSSLLWFVSCGGVAGTLTVVFVDAMYDGDPPDHGGLLFVAGITTVWALVQWWIRKLPLQHLALYTTSLLTVLGVVDALEAGRERVYSTIAWGLAVWVFGVAWTAVGMARLLAPAPLARLLGPATVLIGAQVVRADAEVFGIWLGVATAALLVVLGVTRSDVLVLLVGTGGLFQWSPQVALYYLADTLGAEVTLLIVGALLLGGATILTRAYRRRFGAGRAAGPFDDRRLSGVH